MKLKYILFLLIPALLLAISFYVENKNSSKGNDHSPSITEPTILKNDPPSDPSPEINSPFQIPINRAKERVTKKPFGIFVTKQNSPVTPERFFGYHTGTDFETFPEEQNSDVPVSAITGGKIIEERWISGYGGALVESAVYNDSPITIVYGHLKLESINKKTGDTLTAGEKIGILGKGYSQETDGERKHLHLGIKKGAGVDVRGYVQTKSELDGWIDAISIL